MLHDFLLDIGISAILTTLKLAFKNPETKAQIRKAMLKIYTQIGIVYGADVDFIDSAVKVHELEK